MLYNSGRVYEGEWSYNKRDGKGYEKFVSLAANSNETIYWIDSPKFQSELTKHRVFSL